MDALVAWLQSQLPGVSIEPRWPSPDKDLPPKAVTLVFAGPRKDLQLPAQILGYTNVNSTQSSVRYQISACEQPVQLDVWAQTDVELDDLLARLDDALNCGDSPVGTNIDICSGVLVSMTGTWADSYADFMFDIVENINTPDSVRRGEYRATLRGLATVMLATTRATARQTLITFQANLAASDAGIITTTVNSTGSTTTL